MSPLKTYLLLAVLTALFGVAGFALAGPTGMLIALAIAMAMNLWAYWSSDKMVLGMYRARRIDPSQASGALRVYADIVAELSRRAEIPVPAIYVIDNDQPNAFATGRDPQHATVAATTGLLRILERDELRGVIAHELAHIRNRDTLTMTIAATLAGAISGLANIGFFFGGRDDEGRSNLFVDLALMLLAPLAAFIVQMAISRAREYEADRIGGEISRDPDALARALRKIEACAKGIPNPDAERNPASAHMFIINPLHGGRGDNLISTHPDTENRIHRLTALAMSLRRQGIGAQKTFTSVPTTDMG